MACTLTAGYQKSCKDAKSGIKSLYLTEFGNVSYTLVSGEITAITRSNGTRFWKYQLEHETSNAQSVVTQNRANGSIATDETINIVLNENTKETRNQLVLLAKNELFVIVEHNDGTYEAYGLDNGMVMATDTRLTGTALGERNGHEIVFSGRESQLPPKVDSTIIAALLIPAS